MSTDRPDDTGTNSSHGSEEGEAHVPGAGDDGRTNREQIAETGEPQRDALGNADGAS